MGMEAVDTILKAIQGAKNRRAEGEDAAERLKFQHEQLKQQQDQFNKQNDLAKSQHELAVRVAEIQMQADQARIEGEQQKILEGIAAGKPAPGGYKVEDQQRITGAPQGGLPDAAPSDTAIGSQAPNFPQFMGKVRELQPQPRQVVTNRQGQQSVQLTPQDYAKQQGEIALAGELPKMNAQAAITAKAAETAHKYNQETAAELARVADKMQAQKAGIDYWLQMQKQKFDEGEHKKDRANAYAIASLKSNTDIEADIPQLEYWGDLFFKGAKNLEDLKKMNFSKPQQEYIRGYLKKRGGDMLDDDKLTTITAVGDLGNIAGKERDLAMRLTTEGQDKNGKHIPGWDATKIMAKNAVGLSYEDKTLIERLAGSDAEMSRTLNAQQRASNMDAKGTRAQYLPNPVRGAGTDDNQATLLAKADALDEKIVQIMDSNLPGISDEQKLAILRARNIHVPTVLLKRMGLAAKENGTPPPPIVKPEVSPVVNALPGPKKPGSSYVDPRTVQAPAAPIVPQATTGIGAKVAKKLQEQQNQNIQPSIMSGPAATSGGVKANRP